MRSGPSARARRERSAPLRCKWSVLLTLGLSTGCGYVGPVLPPSPLLPQAVTDLTVVERGDQLVIAFSTPARTTDNLPVREFSEIDLRMGPYQTPFEFAQWAASATPYEVAAPVPGDPQDPVAFQISKSVPVHDLIGKHLAVAVRTAVRKNDHYSAWSNRVVLDVISPLAPPVVTPLSTPKGVLLTWPSSEAGLEYRIYRKSGTDTASVQLGTSKTADFLDTTSQYDTPYDYTVVAAKGLAESLPSRSVAITTQDKFAPSVPASLTALPAPNSIEVSWQRSPESDLKGYFVHRSVNGSPYQGLGGLLTVPAFSDHSVEHGKTYRYQVSAVDQKNNESAPSTPVEVTY